MEEVNYAFALKEATGQPGRLDFVVSKRKEIGDHDNDKHWNLVRRIKINKKKNII